MDKQFLLYDIIERNKNARQPNDSADECFDMSCKI